MRFLTVILIIQTFSLFGQKDLNDSDISNNALPFVPNHGQIADLNYSPRPDVLFQIENKGIFLRENGISYVFTNTTEVEKLIHEEKEEFEHSEDDFSGLTEEEWLESIHQKNPLKRQQFDMSFVNSNAEFSVISNNNSSDYLNYYLPQCQDGALKIHSSTEVLFKDIYDGISAKFYAAQTGFKYDLIVAPFADPNQIQLEWSGADSVYVDEKGHLILESDFHTMTESIPKVFQNINDQTKLIEAAYNVEKTEDNVYLVRFKLGDYNVDSPLIIDPWVTNYGGISSDNTKAIATDEEGNVYITGLTGSNMAISYSGYQESYGGGIFDAYLVKFNEAGVRLWGTYYGGGNLDVGQDVTVDSDGKIYLAGSTGSFGVIATAGAHDTEYSGGGGDGFLVKFNPDGTRIWGTYYGGIGAENADGLNTDPFGNVFLCGTTTSVDAIATAGCHQSEYAGNDLHLDGLSGDAFLVKFDTDGNRLWGTYYGGINGDRGHKTISDTEGNVYLCGSTLSSGNIAFDGFQNTYGGHADFATWEAGDGFLVKFSPDGVRDWGTYYGGEFGEYGNDVATDEFNDVYLTGWTRSPGSELSHEGYQSTYATLRDGYLVKFNTMGDRIWATYYGGVSEDNAFAVCVDPATNNVMIGGDTYSSNLPVTPCAIQTEKNGIENAFIAQFTSDGELYCASFFGGYHEEGNVITNNGCYIYIAGQAPVNLATPGSHQEEFGGGYSDAFLAQIYTSSCGIDVPEINIEMTLADAVECTEGCTGEATANINIISCTDNPNGFDYIWSNGFEILDTIGMTSVISDLCPGEYWLKVNWDCATIDTIFFTIEVGEPLEANFGYGNACVNRPVLFTNESETGGGEIISYNWDFGDGETSTDENPSHTYPEDGIYIVTFWIENNHGCVDTITESLTIGPNFEVEVDFFISEETFFEFPDGTGHLISVDTTQVSNLISIHGCDSTIITSIWRTGLTFETPNIFTPNSDFSNNNFFFSNQAIDQFNCIILNRWGVEVFRFNSIHDEWDGRDMKNGRECTNGVYFYTYSGTFNSGEPFQGQGTIQLVRD